ncbi:hypothetical protein DD238_007404 [Peronospora effusa]|uniref:BED-type domain-containing protein n=1 Tax=Peronospora effusa TaxID=542832 RepID=A0A3M6V9V0_9STRA|nr:hypothetical protein DD238_007404 [Peronospora effusa]RQM12339.1 hypothetical protein DD237_007682 [Peronospora effusa]
MGRGCSLNEWTHFQKLSEEGHVSNSSYWYVLCRHCVTGFEQKQLLNAPVKLTGRRSAMRAHLKSCPMYAHQYKIEQIALEKKSTVQSIDDGVSAGEKRKRKTKRKSGEGRNKKHCMMEEWAHFNRLEDEGYIDRSNFYYATCKYCEKVYDEASEDQKSLLVPEKLVGRREKMRKHLSLCRHFKAELPSLERRWHQRSNIIPRGTTVAAGALAVTHMSSAESIVATTFNNGSSRLALDEWHYFTRLERKKGSAYYYARCNFCQQAYEKAPDSMKTSMKPAIIIGRKGNMQTHLAKCLHMPKEPSAIAKVYETGYSTKLGDGASAAPKLDTTVVPEPKRTKLDVDNESSLPSPDETSVHRALMRIIIEYHLPFEWVESDSVKHLFCALVPVTGATGLALLPSTTDLRTHILDKIHTATLFSELTKLQNRIPLELGTSAFFNNAVDTLSDASRGSWPVMLHCNFSVAQQLGSMQVLAINGVLTNGKAIVPLSFIRAQKSEAAVEAALAHNHGLEVARWLDEHIRLCVSTTKLALSAVVLPYNSITQRAVGILRSPKHWPQVVFLPDIESMLQFPLLKLLATPETFVVVSSLIEIWQLESVRTCMLERLSEMDSDAHASPFRDWESCATLMQVLLDHKSSKASTKRGAATAKRLVENAFNHSLLERVCNLLHAFMKVFCSCRTGLTLSEAMVQLSVLFTAAKGFSTVQLALEMVWEQMEQPLYVLAYVLNPRLRLRDINSTAITKLSTLSDLSVSYFMSIFGRKPNSLRGEVTAYLHESQRVFTTDFIAEFPVVDDYFCYLSDNYPSLSMLMKVLCSFSSSSIASRTIHSTLQNGPVSGMYTNDEQLKLDYLRDRWGIVPTASLEPKSRVAVRDSHSGAAILNADVVVDEWKKVLESKLHGQGVDLSLLVDKVNGVDDSDRTVDVTRHGDSDTTEEVNGLRLPLMELDNELTFPSVSVHTEFSTKVPLKELFKTGCS